MAVAQQERSLEIDASSFRPVQVSDIEGVAIDKIQQDHSKRPCARIKMRINRMTRDDIAQLSVQVVGGIVELTKKMVAIEGNGLIIELTAKPETRFYLHHDKYGDSNVVNLDLEGDKEYYLDAELRLQQSIVINAGIAGADVYLDGEYRGITNSISELTIEGVTLGDHTLLVQHGSAKIEEEIEVTTTSIHFRVEIDSAQARAQYVVFNVSPKTANITVDGKAYSADADGYLTLRLHNGTHSYEISALHYHPTKEQFTVEGKKRDIKVELLPAHGRLHIPATEELRDAKVYVDNAYIGTVPVTSDILPSGNHTLRIVKPLYETFEGTITISDGQELQYTKALKADFANVVISSDAGSNIYVNEQYKGKSPWSGRLGSGIYSLEARKEGHRFKSIDVTISANPKEQKTFTLPSPEPILGFLDVRSTPNIATVKVDGKEVGTTPIEVELLIGSHNVTISKDGYTSENRSVTINEAATTTLDVTLSEGNGTLSVTSSPTGAMVYVDGRYAGVTPLKQQLPSGSHSVEVKRSGYNSVTRNVVITRNNTEYVTVSLKSTQYSSASGSSASKSSYNSSSYNSQRSSYRSYDRGFNVGFFADFSYAGESYGSSYSYDYSDTASSVFGFGLGFNWRLWRYNSIIIPFIGARYKYFSGNTHFVGFPLTLNINWGRLFTEDYSIYFGAGIEPCFVKYSESNEWNGVGSLWDYSVALNLFGFGDRHNDLNIYLNVNINSDLLFCGMRYTYFF